MSGMPLVSVVAIFYNEERFLDDAIGSVVAQTFTDWELLLVDDGSLDASREIARKWEVRFPGRIRCFEHPGRVNRGTSASRNRAIDQARGRWLAPLDGDDAWLPHKLETQLRLVEAHAGVGITYSSPELWYSWTGVDSDRARDHVPDPGLACGVPVDGRMLLPGMIERRFPSPCPSSMLVRTEAARAVGGFEEAFVGMYDDQVFTAKILVERRRCRRVDSHRTLPAARGLVLRVGAGGRAGPHGQAGLSAVARAVPCGSSACDARAAVHRPTGAGTTQRGWCGPAAGAAGQSAGTFLTEPPWRPRPEGSRSMNGRHEHAGIRRVPILMYHQVTPDPHPAYWKYAIAPDAFAAQMQWIADHGYVPVSLDQFAAPGAELPAGALVITFDDGFQDVVDHAVPILQRFGFRATFFLVAGLVGTTSRWLVAERGLEYPLMDWSTARALLDAGFECGIPRVDASSAGCRFVPEVVRELRDSRAVLEDGLGRAVRHLAYPFGSHDTAVRRVAADCGYISGCTVDPGLARAGDDRLALRRVHVMAGSLAGPLGATPELDGRDRPMGVPGRARQIWQRLVAR